MLETFKSLPEDPDELRTVSAQMLQYIQSQAYQIEKLKAELHGHRKARFGAKSEGIDQLALDLSEDDEIAQVAKDQHTGQPSSDDEAPNQLIERDLPFGGDARIYPTGYSSQLSMSAAIPLRLRQKRSRFAPQFDQVVHEFRRHPEMTRRLAVSMAFIDKRDNTRSQLYWMWLAHL